MKKIMSLFILITFTASPVIASNLKAEQKNCLAAMAGKWRNKSIFQSLSTDWNTFLRSLVNQTSKTS